MHEMQQAVLIRCAGGGARPVSAPLPPLAPGQEQKITEFAENCNTVLDSYVKGFELDLNRHAVKHGQMPQNRAVNDLTVILIRDVPHNMLAGLLATAILRMINRKVQGRG